MRVTPSESEPFVYFVESAKPGHGPYRVDLTEYDGNGWCACMDFHTRHQPKLKDRPVGKRLWDYKCKHLIAAHLLNSMATVRICRDRETQKAGQVRQRKASQVAS